MPRRPEMTLGRLKFTWDPMGTAASARAAVLTRPMGREIARVLLPLVDGRSSGDGVSPTVATLAGHAGLSAQVVRAAVHDLLATGCVIHQRERRGRRSDEARWARGVELAPRGTTRGPGRRPRLVPLALLIEPDLACGDLMDVLLRRAGVLAVQATNGDEAVRLLAEIGFDLVLVDSSSAMSHPGAGALARAIRTAACGHTVLLRRRDAPVALDHRAVGLGVTLGKPFSIREFDAAIEQMSLGAMTALAL